MSLEDIKKEITTYGDKASLEIKQDFDQQKKVLEEKLAKEYEELKALEMKAIEKEITEEYQGALLSFKINERKKILDAKQNIIDTLVKKVKTSLKEIVGEDTYYGFIKDKVEKYAQEGDTVYLSKSDISFKDKLSQDLKISLNIQTSEIESGVIVAKKTSNYNFTPKSLIEENYAEIEKLIGENIHVLSI